MAAHCRHGHPFAENLRYTREGWRYCITCRRASWRDSKRRAYVTPAPDHAAIHRAKQGDPPEHLTPRERAAVVLHLRSKGLSASEIARRVQCTDRTVYRICDRYTAAA